MAADKLRGWKEEEEEEEEEEEGRGGGGRGGGGRGGGENVHLLTHAPLRGRVGKKKKQIYIPSPPPKKKPSQLFLVFLLGTENIQDDCTVGGMVPKYIFIYNFGSLMLP